MPHSKSEISSQSIIQTIISDLWKDSDGPWEQTFRCAIVFTEHQMMPHCVSLLMTHTRYCHHTVSPLCKYIQRLHTHTTMSLMLVSLCLAIVSLRFLIHHGRHFRCFAILLPLHPSHLCLFPILSPIAMHLLCCHCSRAFVPLCPPPASDLGGPLFYF